METSSVHQETPPPSYLLPSPTSNGGLQLHSPKPITRSESVNPYPTTFVQADSSSFKQVVQMLTGSPETAKQASAKPSSSDSISKTHIPPIKSLPKRQPSGFKLYERRNSLNKLRINPLIPVLGSACNSGFSPRKPEILSPSILDFPALALSPVTPLIPDPFDRSGLANCSYLKNGSVKMDAEAEDKAIKEKGFYLHPSPTTTPRDSEPRLLPLFPLTSPRVPVHSVCNGRQGFGRWRNIFRTSSFGRSFGPWCQRSYLDDLEVYVSDAGSVSPSHACSCILFHRFLADSSRFLLSAYSRHPFLAS